MVSNPRFPRLPHALMTLGLLFLLVGSYYGLAVAPPEHYMGEVQRIMYVHVPTAWNWMLAVLFTLGAAIAYLFTSDFKWDARVEAGLEVGALLGFLLCCQGAIWAKPTWGVWWDWDPRLTSTAVLLCSFAGILALRRFVDDPAKRATLCAVAAILASVEQSSPATVSSQFHLPLRVNAFGILFLMSGFIALRARIASQRLVAELAPPPQQDLAGELA